MRPQIVLISLLAILGTPNFSYADDTKLYDNNHRYLDKQLSSCHRSGDVLNKSLSTISSLDSSFTSPDIGSNNFNRTETFDFAYYALFLPKNGSRWQGNLKKLRVNSNGEVVDKNGASAIDNDGNIKRSACTFWATSCGGSTDEKSQVEKGGVAASLITRNFDKKPRKIYINTITGLGLDTQEALKNLNRINAANGSIQEQLAAYMGTSKNEIGNTFKWLKGIDVDDENKDGLKTDKREDILGDPLHSKPLAINFGTPTHSDMRILFGTNQGLLHMFKDKGSSVDESWAFIPHELLPNLILLRHNTGSGHKVYGMDSSPVAYIEYNITGKLKKAWVYAGMRRGGTSYYALKITDPDHPKFAWRISPQTSGFASLGQTWSKPVVTTVPGVGKVGNDGKYKSTPVLIFGGGFAPNYDNNDNNSSNNAAIGSSIYIVDAKKGGLVHTFGAGTDAKVTPLAITHSIPNSVAILDSNNDGVTDRIYATDTGGNVWRMDLPSSDQSTWTGYKFAELGGGSVGSASDRHFFSAPVVAQTVFNNTIKKNGVTTYLDVPYDAVTIGSGNRPVPSENTTADMFFVLQDRNVISKSYDGTTNPIAPITLDKLYDVTESVPSSLGSKLGWYYRFKSLGEKSLSEGLIVDGKVYFTSYVPQTHLNNAHLVCNAIGQGRMYIFDLHKGTRTTAVDEDEYYDLGNRVPDTPQVVIPKSGGRDDSIYIIGIGKGNKDQHGNNTGSMRIRNGLKVNKLYYYLDY